MDCVLCKGPIGDLAPSEKTLRRLKRIARMEFDGRVCLKCYRVRTGGNQKGRIGGRFRHLVVNSRACALASLIAEDYQKFSETYVQITEDFARAEKHLKKTLDELQQLTRVRNNLFNLKGDIERAMQESEFGRYVARRLQANKHISNPEHRRRIFARDGFKCLKCNTGHDLSIDHIKSVVDGGDDQDDNLQTLCLSCNCSKGGNSYSFRRRVMV